MPKTEGENPPKKFSDLLKTSWVKSSIKIGIIFAAIGLTIILLLKIFNVGDIPLFENVKMFVENYGLVGIFFATILAGTLVPLGSPALVAAAAFLGMPKIPLILMATTGFSIGIMINYSLAYFLGTSYVVKKVSAEKLEEITNFWNLWGWILYVIFGLIPVLPVELLSFVCGLLKMRPDVLLILSFVPRLVVFTVLAYFGEYVSTWIGIG